jgi:hypothetical protein
LLQDRRPLVLRTSLLRLAAVGGSVLLFPSAPAAFVSHTAGALLIQHLRMSLSPLPAFVCPAVGAVLNNHLWMRLSPLMDAGLLLSVDLLSTVPSCGGHCLAW